MKTPQCFLTALGTKSKLSIMAYEKVTFKRIIVQTKMGPQEYFCLEHRQEPGQ